jgi:hypothetical protein
MLCDIPLTGLLRCGWVVHEERAANCADTEEQEVRVLHFIAHTNFRKAR